MIKVQEVWRVYMVYTRAGAGGRSFLSLSVTVWTQDGEDILLSDLSGRIVQRFESVAFYLHLQLYFI